MANNTTAISEKAQKAASDEIFEDIMRGRGIGFALIKLKPYDWGGQPGSSPQLYRRYDYNDNGKVIKKLGFDTSGHIEIKEEYVYKKERLIASLFTTNKGIWSDSYDYNKDGKLLSYQFLNISLNHQSPEKEEYEYDSFGRTALKRTFDRNGFPALVTEYIYDSDKTKNYSFRSVTDANGKLVITFAYKYNDQGKLKRLAEIKMHYQELLGLSPKAQETAIGKSHFISHYLYNKDGLIKKYIRTIPQGEVLNLESKFLGTGKFIITNESDYDYVTIQKKEYLNTITEYNPRYREPVLVKEYSYFKDKDHPIVPTESK